MINILPLQKYIDAKDEFDYKHNNYATTEFLDTTPDEGVRQVQQRLNELGYTDKFGEKLKEDGIEGAKTLYALDRYESATPKRVDYQLDYAVYYPEKDAPRMLSNEELAQKYGDSTLQLTGVKSSIQKGLKDGVEDIKRWYEENYNKKPLSSGGYLSDEDVNNKDYSDTKKTMIKALSSIWHRHTSEPANQYKIHNQADRLRDFDDNSITKAYLLNDSNGAVTAGHNAIMLVDKDGRGVIFSVFPTKISQSLYTNAELRFSALSKEKVDAFVNNNGNEHWIYDMPATDGWIQQENYNRLVEFEVSNEQGSKMFEFAVSRYDSPGKYMLLFENCDHFSVDCFDSAGVSIKKNPIPNFTYGNVYEL